MANYRINFSARLQDGNSVNATALAYVNEADTLTLASAVTALNAWLTALDAVTDGVITETRMLILPGLPAGLKTKTSVTTTWQLSRVDQVGGFLFSNTSKVSNWGFAIPTFSQALVSGGQIDNGNAAVATIVNLMATTPYCTPESLLNNGFLQSSQQNRTKRKQLQSKSKNSTPV